MCTVCLPSARGTQTQVSHLQDLELWMVVSHHLSPRDSPGPLQEQQVLLATAEHLSAPLLLLLVIEDKKH